MQLAEHRGIVAGKRAVLAGLVSHKAFCLSIIDTVFVIYWKFFPGYILVKMELTDETWHIVKETSKVTGFVGGNTPFPIADEEVNKITRRMEEGAEKPRPKVLFEVGETVRVIDGPFLNFSGIVEDVKPDKGKLRVTVTIFGRATPVELEFMQVEKN